MTTVTSRPLLEQLLLEVSPRYAEASQIDATLRRWQTNPILVNIPDPVDTVWMAALNGEEPTEEFIRTIGINQAILAGWNHWRTAVQRALELARQQRLDAIDRAHDEVLARIQTMLDHLVANVRGIAADLDGAASADEAISAGSKAASAWAQLRDHVAEYDRVRAAQRSLFVTEDLSGDQVRVIWTSLLTVGQFRDHLDVDPYWLQRRKDLRIALGKLGVKLRGTPRSDELTTWAAQPGRPLPGSCVASRGWWLTTDHAADLLTICTQTQPWIPSATELEAADFATTATTIPTDGGNRGGIGSGVQRAVEALTIHHQTTAEKLS